MKKFEDFKQLPNESIADMHARLLKIIGEIRGLRKEISRNDICLKVIRGLRNARNMKVTTMQDHKDLRTLSTNKVFNNIKVYEFEMFSQLEKEKDERSFSLMENNHLPHTR